MIRLARPTLDQREQEAVAAVLRSGALVQGALVAEFERRVAERIGRSSAVAVSSGTAGLSLALQALGVGPGDEVLCPDLTWPSPAHAVMSLGARPILVDVDSETWNASPEAFAAARTPGVRAAIAIDQFGVPCQVGRMMSALGNEVPVLLDAACSLGSHDGDRPAGALGAIACLSFHPRKVITTGEGGMCLTDNPRLAERLRILRNHGQRGVGDFAEAAGNFRLTEMAAALGLAQLEKLDAMVTARRRLADRYRSELTGLVFQGAPAGATPNVQTLGVLLPKTQSRDEFIRTLASDGVEAGKLSYALHRLPTLRVAAIQARAAGRTFPVSEMVADRGVALPLYPELADADQTSVIEAVKRALRGSLA